MTWWMTLASTYVLCPGLWLWGWLHILEWRESHQNRGPKEVEQELEWTEIRIGPDDINLQTKEIYYNYSVLIESLE